MTFLLDSNVLLRLHQVGDAQQPECVALMQVAQRKQYAFSLCTQTLVEFWVVATRPPARNGLGYSASLAEAAIANLLEVLPFIADPPDLFERWRALVGRYAVHGLPAHDAKLVALIEAFQLSGIVTFNAVDFRRYSTVMCMRPTEWLARYPDPV